jgi:hypothetical protein
VTIPYVLDEVGRNLAARERGLGTIARESSDRGQYPELRPSCYLQCCKDRPILFSALAWADVLLTLDSRHFGDLLGGKTIREIRFRLG